MKYVEVNIEMEVYLLVLWKRGVKRISTRGKVRIGGDQKKAELNEVLTMIGTLHQDIESGKYQEKKVRTNPHQPRVA